MVDRDDIGRCRAASSFVRIRALAAFAAVAAAAGVAVPAARAQTPAVGARSPAAGVRPSSGQVAPTLELTSPLFGTEFRSLPDTAGAIARADSLLAAAPSDVERILAAAAARASVWRYGEAIELYGRAIARAPEDWRPYRFRGHRYISLRRLDEAVADLERASALEPLSFDVAYHLGLAYYVKGEFDRAAAVYGACMARAEDPELLARERSGRLPEGFRSCMRMATNDNDRVAITDWRYRSLLRAGRRAEADRLLDAIRPEMEITSNTSYHRSLLFYKGRIPESELLDRDALEGNQFQTIGYGVATWHLARGDTARARELLGEILMSDIWQAFGYIAAEADWLRLGWPAPGSTAGPGARAVREEVRGQEQVRGQARGRSARD